MGESPETMRKLCLSTKFPYQEIRLNYGIFCCEYRKIGNRKSVFEPVLQSIVLFTAHCAAEGLVYSECGKTCSNFNMNSQDLKCQSGCFCPEGKVLHENGTCVDPNNECQCLEGEQFYNKGEVSPSDCSK